MPEEKRIQNPASLFGQFIEIASHNAEDPKLWDIHRVLACNFNMIPEIAPRNQGIKW